MELTVQNVYGLLLRSKLLPMDDCKALFSRWQEEARDGSTDLGAFAAWMVARGYVTEYQASLLARGHADGFFINEYKILDRLGKGRMAGVYMARHSLGQTVAIKVLPPSKARDPLLLARFQRETKLALRLRHPNVVRAYQVGVCGGLHYLVMEHLEGETLEEVLLSRQQLPVDEAVRLVYQALLGLQHIHEEGLIHRDIKPANLMLVPAPRENTRDCTVKILDMGLGRVLSEEGLESPDAGLTSEGVLLGTPDYMAPEQARDPRLTDIRADIYSAGCVLYHLLAGRPPFSDTNIITQMIRHATEPIRPLAEVNPAVPDGLQQIVNWMMAKDPAGRYPTPDRAAKALEMFLAAGATPASNPDLDPSMQSYLRWLETANKASAKPTGPSVPPATTPAPEAQPVPAASSLLPTTPLLALSQESPVFKPPSGTLPAASSPGNSVRPPDADAQRPKKRSSSGSPDPLKNQKKATPPQVPLSNPAVNVELVNIAAEPPRADVAGWELTRRDFFLFFAGVVSGLTAYAIGRALASLLGR